MSDSPTPHRKLGILELLRLIGEDNIRLHNLVESATNFQSRGKNGRDTAITFVTDQMNPTEIALGTARHIGLVLWLPTDLVKRAQEQHAKEAHD